MQRSLIAVGAVVFALVGVAGCSSPNGGTATPTTSAGDTTSAGSAPTNLDGAPHISDPLDTSKFQSDPCSSVTSAQLAALNIGTTAKASNAGGPTCNWGATDYNANEPATAGVGYLTDASGLSTLYGQKSTYAVFQVLPPIDSYPAVFAPTVDQRAQGNCDITVGVSDKLAIDIQIAVNSGPQKTDPCTPDQQLAADVISNIKNGGS